MHRITGTEVNSLNEAYANVYMQSEDVEQIDEIAPALAIPLVAGAGYLAHKGIQHLKKKANSAIDNARRGATINGNPLGGDLRMRRMQNNSYEPDMDVFDIVKEYLMVEHGANEEEAHILMLGLTEEEREYIILESPRSREFENRHPKESGSRGREFEHGSTRSANTPSGNLSANRGRGSRGPEFRHGSGEGPYDTRGTAIKNPKNLSRNTGRYPRDKKGNLMY